MRWTKPIIGETRVKTKFLIFPKQMQDFDRIKVVTKWLEKASWVEYYKCIGFNCYGEPIGRWIKMSWFI